MPAHPGSLRIHDARADQTVRSCGSHAGRLCQPTPCGKRSVVTTTSVCCSVSAGTFAKLARSVTTRLRDLGFKKSVFEIVFAEADAPTPHGLETIDFLFEPNPGEPAKPLKAIASSGEISRVMLAVKSALATSLDRVPASS